MVEQEQELCIWSDLLDRVAFYSEFASTFYLFTLPESKFIIHAQSQSTDHLNLSLIGVGQVVEEGSTFTSLQQGMSIIIYVNQQREVGEVKCQVQGQTTNISIKRSCDVNDLFKQYIALYTNIKLDDCEELKLPFYAIIQEDKPDLQLIYKITMDGNLELQQETIQKKQIIAKGKKQTKEVQKDPNDNLQTLFKDVRGQYKDALGNLGKLSNVKHPPLIQVGICQPKIQRVGLEGIGISAKQQQVEVMEHISYHKFDSPIKQILLAHFKPLMKSCPQALYYTDQSVVALTKSDSYYLPKSRQLYTVNNRILSKLNKFKEPIEVQNDKLLNVHHYLPPRKIIDTGRREFIRGDYVFHHYMQDGFDDKGWGCAYRSFMTVLSWLNENGYTKRTAIPSHIQIQKLLVEMNDKPMQFVGTSEWIGAFEVSMLLNKLTGVDCKILHVSNGLDIPTKISDFVNHFRQQGSPIMFGGGVYAYTLLGIEYNSTGQCKFLILDPHYTASDNIKPIIEKGGISWKNSDMFLPGTFYNFCMPQVE